MLQPFWWGSPTLEDKVTLNLFKKKVILPDLNKLTWMESLPTPPPKRRLNKGKFKLKRDFKTMDIFSSQIPCLPSCVLVNLWAYLLRFTRC